MFEYIYKSTSKLLFINGFKLLVVTFTPFATGLLSKYINTPEQQTAVSVYAFNFTLMGSSMFIIWLYAYKNKLMKESSTKVLKIITKFYSLAVLIPFTIFLLSFVNIWLCLALSGIMFIIFLFPELSIRYFLREGQR